MFACKNPILYSLGAACLFFAACSSPEISGTGATVTVRQQVVPNAALFRTAGAGMAWPGSGAQGHPSRVDVAYPVSTVDEARAAVQDYVRMKPEFIKIRVCG